MPLRPYTVVQLTTNQYCDRGVPLDSIGTILEVYSDEAYEVEFSRSDGTTIDWFAVPQNAVKPIADSSLTTAHQESA
jgi:Domain of unknown function (DUF4926)